MRVDEDQDRAKVARMTSEAVSSVRAFWRSTLIGAYGGMILQSFVGLSRGPIDTSDLWALPVIILVYGLFALPFVALGLAFFGWPATALLRRWAQSWWVGVVAALWGAAAGKLMFYAIDHHLFFGFSALDDVTLTDPGILYGVPTGLAWWWFYRQGCAGR